jgi:hypothetical protein
MIKNGWDRDSLDFIQRVADSPALPNPGRTREQIMAAAGWYAAVIAPGAQPDIERESEVHQNVLSQSRSFHRRRDTEYWQHQKQQEDYQPRASLMAAYTQYPEQEPGETRATVDADDGQHPFAAASQDQNKGQGKKGSKGGKGKNKGKSKRFGKIVKDLYG